MDRCVPDTIIEPAVSVDLLLVGADVLLDRLDCDTFGLTTSDAEHRLAFTGPNLLSLEQRSGLLAALLRQLPHPLALLLWLAAALALGTQGVTLGLAIICVIGLNAGFALVQERHAEHAVAALALYLPRTRAWSEISTDAYLAP